MPTIQIERRIPRYARKSFPGKTRFRKRFDDTPEGRAAAEIWASSIDQRIAAARAGAQLATVGAKKSISFFLASAGWIDQLEVKPATMAWYKQHLKKRLNPIIGQVQLSDLDKSTLDAYKAHRKRECNRFGEPTAGRDIEAELAVALRVVRWARSAGYAVDESAFSVVPPKSKPKAQRRYDPDLVQRFIQLVQRGPSPSKGRGAKRPEVLARIAARETLAVLVMARLGLRAGELRAMSFDWVRWNERRLVVPFDETYSPKGGQSRSIPIESDLLSLLRDEGRGEGRVFEPERKGRPRGGKWHKGTGIDVESLMRRLAKRTGIELKAHDLRHHAISRWCDLMTAGAYSISDVQEWAGHEDIRTTQLYIHQAGGRWRAHAAALDRAASGSLPSEVPSPSPKRPRLKVV